MNNKKKRIYNRKYEKIAKIGEGTYGKVMLVIDINQKPQYFSLKPEESQLNSYQDILKIPIFAIKKSKETQKHQSLQVFFLNFML